MRYILGVDGGGTKTTCLLANEEGCILKRIVSGPSNPESVGEKKAKENLSQAIKTTLKGQKVEVICLGLAGVDLPEDAEKAYRFVKRLKVAKKIIVENDGIIALSGATVCKPGVVVSAGTGAIVFGLNKAGEKTRASGWGYILGDEGSGYDIARRGIIAAIKALDGRGENTSLLNKIPQYFKQPSIISVALWVYSSDFQLDKMAGLSPVITKAAREGDKVAQEVIREAAKELALAAGAVIKNLRMEKDEFEIACTGGVFKAKGLILSTFKSEVKKIAPQSKVIFPKFSAASGAVLMGLKEAGVELKGKVLKNISSRRMSLRAERNVIASRRRSNLKVLYTSSLDPSGNSKEDT